MRIQNSRLNLLFLMVISIFCLQASDGCPIQVGATEEIPATSDEGYDIGGASGAVWTLTYQPTIEVTLQDEAQNVETTSIEIGGPAFYLLGHYISVTDFCLRSDVICPQHLLPNEWTLQQPTETNSVLASFNARGPLAQLGINALSGILDGKEITIPLGVQNGQCGLDNASAVRAEVELNDEEIADQMSGRINLVYNGFCFTIGGSANLSTQTYVQLKINFEATRSL